MHKLIPEGDYFKHTTCIILTNAEKQEIIDAVQRALDHLFEMSERMEYKYTTYADGRVALQINGYRLKYLSRCVHLIKGASQPRYLYGASRRASIENEARQIAKETGAPYQEVKEAFLSSMEKYI